MEKIGFFNRLKERLGSNGPGLTVAVIAMIVALTGGAFAATGGLTGKQKKEVKAIAKKFAGQNGAPGAPGAQGVKGDVGPKGDTGAPGQPGKDGKDGEPGKDGTSVIVTPVASGEPMFECEERGGAILKEGPEGPETEICNGKAGDPGSLIPLPAGAQETGTWSVSGNGAVETPLSFAVELAANVANAKVFYGDGEEEEVEVSPGVKEPTNFQKHCLGNALGPEVAPTAEPRTLCIYNFRAQSTSANFVGVTRVSSEPPGATRVGGFLHLNITAPGTVWGTFAVSGG